MFTLAKSIAFVLGAALVAQHAASLQVTFPNGSNDGYWVACHHQTLRWTSTPDDAPIFSVALLNSNQSFLNRNYQIANSLNTSLGEAPIFVNCVAPGTYSVLLVNASQYSLDKPQVYATSSPFQLMPNGTDPSRDDAAGSLTSSAAGSSTSADPTSSSTTTSATTGATGTTGSSSTSSSYHPTSSSHPSSSAHSTTFPTNSSATVSPSATSATANSNFNGAHRDGQSGAVSMFFALTGTTLLSAAIELVAL